MELKFRPAKTQYLMTPPASISSSEEMDVDEMPSEPMDIDKLASLPIFQFKAGISNNQPQTNQPSFRRRIGRLQRLWIDRRGMTTTPRQESNEYSDRWKYDSDDDDADSPVYEVDPFDTRALKFRATIPLSPYMYRGARAQMPPDAATVAAVAVGNRALPQPPSAAQAQAAS